MTQQEIADAVESALADQVQCMLCGRWKDRSAISLWKAGSNGLVTCGDLDECHVYVRETLNAQR